ncbi:hypothetical protein DCAR_0416895 [Daucus carota subsp. sativus]|uniref:RRM domain-containing protein n=1 Tax=Daucus carota subsp. sativus TaxID=79200 RepID=A0AAF0WXT1_DAUCS|nr:PREDICTED: RNA-binding protein 24 isoform X2 [Daucus carota subsp. sativus]WOG97554.1 hypothetical protein DCAR_0416895 [Daucus carota subsp. sativus]
MTPANLAGQFGDTTYTKVFVGGLAWETQKETMKKYFEQFGDILEAVVITDKTTGRSKGYGFVTFREPDAAMRACVDAAPVIDGRRANCNLASLGVQRSKPSTPKHGGGRNLRVMSSFQATGFQSGMGGAFPSATTYPHYAIPQGIPYNLYGYSPYSADYTYPTNYYGVYGGAAAQYPMYGGGGGGMITGAAAAAAAFYPYLNFGEGTTGGGTGYTGGQSYGVQYPHHQLYQYSALNSAAAGYPHHYGAPMSLATTPGMQSVCFAVPQA